MRVTETMTMIVERIVGGREGGVWLDIVRWGVGRVNTYEHSTRQGI